MKYEWDENKNNSNLIKHGVDFNQARDVFNDSDRIEIPADGSNEMICFKDVAVLNRNGFSVPQHLIQYDLTKT